MFLRICIGGLAALLIAGQALADAAIAAIVYPRPVSDNDSQTVYDYDLLRLALEKTRAVHGAFELRESDIGMTASRAMEEICGGTGVVNVLAHATSSALETRLMPIRIPLDKGLISYRVFLIRAGDQAHFSAVRTLDELRKWRIGSFLGWSDTAILQESGFSVVTGNSYEGLFKMLVADRFDLFSRSVDEAYREFDERKNVLPDMKVEESILLYLPSARYFFVRRNEEGEKLARRIELGLEKMIKDGSFEALFRKYKEPLIKRAKLGSRKVFRIVNPQMSPETPLNRAELWHKPLALD